MAISTPPLEQKWPLQTIELILVSIVLGSCLSSNVFHQISYWRLRRERERERERGHSSFLHEIDFQGSRGNLRKFTIREQLTRARVNPPRARRVERGEPSRWQTLSISRWPETTTLVPSSSSFYIVPTIKPTAGRVRSILFLTPRSIHPFKFHLSGLSVFLLLLLL